MECWGEDVRECEGGGGVRGCWGGGVRECWGEDVRECEGEVVREMEEGSVPERGRVVEEVWRV